MKLARLKPFLKLSLELQLWLSLVGKVAPETFNDNNFQLDESMALCVVVVSQLQLSPAQLGKVACDYSLALEEPWAKLHKNSFARSLALRPLSFVPSA